MTEASEILVVDDEDVNIIFITEILEEHGYRFRSALNGREAMEKMQESAPDLVLLDIMMPRKSGINVYKEMKASPDLANVPVIFVTGASNVTGVDITTGAEQPKEEIGDEMSRRFGEALHQKYSGLEPDGLIEKPIEPPELIALVEKVLGAGGGD
jgi:CheY-like chemotaxis protein